MTAFLETVAVLLIIVAAGWWWLLERDADRMSEGWRRRHEEGRDQR